jgi:LysM repeat protein
MKRLSVLLLCLACLPPWSLPVTAEDEAARAAAAAEREAAEERYRRLSATVESLLTAQADQQRRLGLLAEELRKVASETDTARSAASRSEGKYATRDELNQVVETIRKLDALREADKKKILEEIQALGKSLSASLATAARAPKPTPAHEPEKKPSTPSTPPADQEGVWYTVEKGNTLTAIIAAHNEEFKKQGRKTSRKLVLEANPKLDADSVYVGQKIFIPMVKE